MRAIGVHAEQVRAACFGNAEFSLRLPTVLSTALWPASLLRSRRCRQRQALALHHQRDNLRACLAVASGEQSKSEALGYGDAEFVPWQVGATM